MTEKSDGTTEITCHVDGQEYTLQVSPANMNCGSHGVSESGQTYSDGCTGSDLVSLLLDAQIPVPYSCREGDCSSCIARVIKGDVKELPSDVLAGSDRDLGYIVACRTLLDSPNLEVTFDD